MSQRIKQRPFNRERLGSKLPVGSVRGVPDEEFVIADCFICRDLSPSSLQLGNT